MVFNKREKIFFHYILKKIEVIVLVLQYLLGEKVELLSCLLFRQVEGEKLPRSRVQLRHPLL